MRLVILVSHMMWPCLTALVETRKLMACPKGNLLKLDLSTPLVKLNSAKVTDSAIILGGKQE